MGWLTNLCARRSGQQPASVRTAIGWGLFLFTALSLADLTLTWVLLERARGCAYESNPVASWWLARFGWIGLAGFKAGIVLIVAALAVVVARHRPRAARRVLVFGCSALLAVILYSSALVYGVEADATDLGRAEEMLRNLDRKEGRLRAYWALLDRLREDLVAHRCTLAEAVEWLEDSERVQDLEWLQALRWRCPGWTRREFLADRLVTHALLPREASVPASEQFAQELDAQLQACFGHPNPLPMNERAILSSQFR
jgi:hypothetical protein